MARSGKVIMVHSLRELSINVAYIEDSEYSTQVNRWFLKPLGVWPAITTASSLEKAVVRAVNVACLFLITCTVVPSILFIIFEEINITARLKGVGPTSHWLMGGLNYSSLLLHRNEIHRCVEHLTTDWRNARREEDRELMLKTAKVGRFVVCMSALGMNVGVLSYSIIVSATMMVVSVGNETVSIYALPCPFYSKLGDLARSPLYEIILVTQFVSGFIVNFIAVGASGLVVVLAMHARGQLNVVMSWLDDFVSEKDEERKIVENKLTWIVQHHLRALSFISSIEKIIHQICFVELTGCTLSLCLLGYYSIREWREGAKNLVVYAIILFSKTFNIFIFCYIGEILSEQCKEVGQRAYMTKWYRLPHKTALGLVLVILRSSCAIKMTAGKLVQLSIPTFGDVIKTSFAYLNILRRVLK